MVETFNAWAIRHPRPGPATLVQADPDGTGGAHPNLGAFAFNLRGSAVKTQAFANVVYHFQRLLDVVASLDDAGGRKFGALMESTGGTDLMSTQMEHRIKSEYYQLFLT